MIPPRSARSRVLMFGCSLVAVGYVTAFYLSSADGALLSAEIASRRTARLSGYQWGGLVAGVLAAALMLPSFLAALPQLMEGSKWYWRATGVMRTWHRRRRDQLRRQWSRQRERVEQDIRSRSREWLYGTPADQAEITIHVDRLAETLAARYPTDNALVRASTVGNVLSAARQQIADAYGLDMPLTWPRLYPVLDRRLGRVADWQRAALDAALSAWSFALLALCVVLPTSLVWNPSDVLAWAAPVAVAVAARLAAVRAALRYSTTVRVAFDLHRFDLYKALHLSAPSDLTEEREVNRALSRQWHSYGAARVRHPARTGQPLSIPVSDNLDEWWRLPDGPYLRGPWTGRGEPRHDVSYGGSEAGDVGSGYGPLFPDSGHPVQATHAQSLSAQEAHTGQPEQTHGSDGSDGKAEADGSEEDDEKQEAELSQLASAARIGTSLAAGGTLAAVALSGLLVAPEIALSSAAVGAVTTVVAQWLSYRREADLPAPEGNEVAPPPPPPLEYEHPTQSPVSVQISDGSLRSALEPAGPVALRGSVAVTFEGAAGVEVVDDEPEWRLRPGEPASVVMLLGLGREHQSDPRALLGGAPGMADEMLVVAGQSAVAVELDIVLDAPFLTVTPDRHSVRQDRGRSPERVLFRRTSMLMGTEPGTYDVRVAVYSSGRLVQALPVTVVVEDVGAVLSASDGERERN